MERSIFGIMLAKKETTYGTDPTPTGAANTIAIRRNSLKFGPKCDHILRQILDGTLSKVSGLNSMFEADFSFEVEFRGNRTNGTAADISAGSSANAVEIDPLLQACDLAPTYTAESTGGARNGSVAYKTTVPSNEGVSCTVYFYSGNRRFKFFGCKGSVKGSLQAGQFGILTFDMKGIWTPSSSVADVDISTITPTWLDTKPPVFINAGAAAVIDSYAGVFSKLDFDLANTVTRRDDANTSGGVKGFLITSRDSKCSIDPESVAEATNPVFGDLEGGTARTIHATFGSQTGNTCQGYFTGVSQAVDNGDRNGIRTNTISYSIERTNISSTVGSEFQLIYS